MEGPLIRLKLIACKVLQRELCRLAAHCGNYVDISFVRQDYHNEPDRLRAALQQEIDRVESGGDPHTCTEEMGTYDAIVLGYGLCSCALCGIASSRFPLVIPRVHDCISLLLGTAERYHGIMDTEPGTYFYSAGWVENTDIRSEDERKVRQRREEYVRLYGEDNAQYLMQFEQSWLSHYTRFAYIHRCGLPDYGQQVRGCAEKAGLAYKKLDGDDTLLTEMLAGRWDEERFLVLRPGQRAVQSFNGRVIAAQESQAE